MPWDPKKYNQFKNIRYRAFFDLADLISDTNLFHSVDIGCGTGEQTAFLSERFDSSDFLGIDSSAEMLAESTRFANEKLHFNLATIEEFVESDTTWDLIFSNAALQWSDNHGTLFSKIISKLNPGGQLAVQMPFQKENILNRILLELVSEKPFVEYLDGFRRDSPVLTVDEYATLLFENGLHDINIFLKVYPIIANSETELVDFISGSALIPYTERMNENERELFIREYTRNVKDYFQSFPAIYPFKRILMHGVRS